MEIGKMGNRRSVREQAEDRRDTQRKNRFSPEEVLLLTLLRQAMTGGGQEREKDGMKQAEQQELQWDGGISAASVWSRMVSMACSHSVLSLLYDVLTGYPMVPETVLQSVTREARKAVLQNWHLLFLSRYLMDCLREAGIETVCLKGAVAAACYPVPELRKSGDVDLLLLEPEKREQACQVLCRCGCTVKKRQLSPHDVAFVTEEKIEVELHIMLAGPFDNRRINAFLQEVLANCQRTAVRVNVLGMDIPALSPAYHGYQMLLHMLQHFLRAGFGLKYLCDWTMFWNSFREQEPPEEMRQCYLRLVRDSRLKGFSDAVTMISCQYLGLAPQVVDWMELSCREDTIQMLMADILEGGEFGRQAANRMVLPRGHGLRHYAREFHNQMRWNFPAVSRCIPCWPVLWAVTLFRFLNNNRKIRRLPASAILRKAGQRSGLAGDLGLWKQS